MHHLLQRLESRLVNSVGRGLRISSSDLWGRFDTETLVLFVVLVVDSVDVVNLDDVTVVSQNPSAKPPL